MTTIIALLAFAAYVMSTRVMFKALASQPMTPAADRTVIGLIGMVVSGLVLGSTLEHLL